MPLIIATEFQTTASPTMRLNLDILESVLV